ncbi:extracellular solute-binding protein [Lachnoclostridium sp. Marseille-P6806]|uniref:extracellular solute-binding protein n=1 Tax=Lachnoclostridium sp. Marseille-P6806 TaxID=2364793 RepID=UPI001030D1CD|nr:extracellular solute-binding protein [Lachnoclostridium sp. Marseille-P6806]
MSNQKLLNRILAVTLTGAMAVGLAACGGGGATGGTAPAGNDGAVKTAQAETDGDDAAEDASALGASYDNPDFYPVADEPVNLSVFTMSMPNVTDLSTNDFTMYLEKLTGVHLEFQTGSRDDWREKLNLALSSGDYPDVILGVNPDLAKYGCEEGIIIPLDDYLTEENCPNYMKMFGDQLDLSREADGKIYSLLSTNDCYHCKYAGKMWINATYLEELGVDMPGTTAEFADVCAKFLEKYPTGIAVGGTEVGSGWHSFFQEWMMNSFLLYPGGSYTLGIYDYTAVNKDGKIVCAATDERYRDFLAYAHELYEAGAIYEGDFTQTQEQLKTLVNNPEQSPVLCMPEGTISDYIDVVSNPDLYKQYVTLPPLEGPDGVRLATYYKYSAVGSGAFMITDKCKDPAAALKWVDFFYSTKGDLCSQYGADEGVDWVMAPEGKVGLNGEPAMYEVLNGYSGEPQNHDWQDIGIRVAPEAYRLGQATDPTVDPYGPDGLEKLLYDASKENYAPYGQTAENSDLDVLPEMKLTAEESSSVATIGVEVDKIIKESQVAFIMGTQDLDAGWDAYLKSLDAAGLQDLLAAYQTVYDRTMGK